MGIVARTSAIGAVLWLTAGLEPVRADSLASRHLAAKEGDGVQEIQVGRPPGANEVGYARAFLRKIRQRTKTRQISGGENLNVMEWTTQEGAQPTMEGAVIYFKLFESAFKYFNSRFNRFVNELPTEWDDYGKYEEAARKFANGDIHFANRFIIDMYEWFKPKQEIIGNQGGVIIMFAKGGGSGSLIAYADPNDYRLNNVAGILTALTYLNRVNLSEDVFFLPRGTDAFIQFVLEDEEGPVKIEVPYVLYEVPTR